MCKANTPSSRLGGWHRIFPPTPLCSRGWVPCYTPILKYLQEGRACTPDGQKTILPTWCRMVLREPFTICSYGTPVMPAPQSILGLPKQQQTWLAKALASWAALRVAAVSKARVRSYRWESGHKCERSLKATVMRVNGLGASRRSRHRHASKPKADAGKLWLVTTYISLTSGPIDEWPG